MFGVLGVKAVHVVGQDGLCLAKLIRKALAQVVQHPQAMPTGANLPILAKRSLIIVVQLRVLVLVQERRFLAHRVRAAAVHIVAQQVAAAAQLDVRQRIHALKGENEAVVVGAEHTAHHFAASVGAILRVVARLEVVGGAHIVVVVVAVDVFRRGGVFALALGEDPRLVGVAAPQRERLVDGGACAAPCRAGVERRVQPDLFHDVLDVHHVLVAAVAARHPFKGSAGRHLPRRGGVHILVVQLGRHHRAALLVVHTINLLVDGLEVAAHAIVEALVAAAHLKGFAVQPIGQCAVAHLTVAEGANAQDHIQAVLFAKLQELADVAHAIPAEGSLHFLVDVPEHIGGYDVQAAHLGFDEGIFPLFLSNAGEVDFAADTEERLVIHGHIIIRESNLFPARCLTAEVFPKVTDRFVRNIAQIKFVPHNDSPFAVCAVFLLLCCKFCILHISFS